MNDILTRCRTISCDLKKAEQHLALVQSDGRPAGYLTSSCTEHEGLTRAGRSQAEDFWLQQVEDLRAAQSALMPAFRRLLDRVQNLSARFAAFSYYAEAMTVSETADACHVCRRTALRLLQSARSDMGEA